MNDLKNDIENALKANGKSDQSPPWTYETVTERQVVSDCITLLMGHESPTFEQIPLKS